MALTFEWDGRKSEGNRRKHGVDFREATTVFRDVLSSTIPDPDHSTHTEDRDLTIGLSYMKRLLVVAHCRRGSAIRIINARPATRRERRVYEEG